MFVVSCKNQDRLSRMNLQWLRDSNGAHCRCALFVPFEQGDMPQNRALPRRIDQADVTRLPYFICSLPGSGIIAAPIKACCGTVPAVKSQKHILGIDDPYKFSRDVG